MSEIISVVAIVAGATTANVAIGAYVHIKKYATNATTDQMKIKTEAETEQMRIKTNADIEMKRLEKGYVKPAVPQTASP